MIFQDTNTGMIVVECTGIGDVSIDCMQGHKEDEGNTPIVAMHLGNRQNPLGYTGTVKPEDKRKEDIETLVALAFTDVGSIDVFIQGLEICKDSLMILNGTHPSLRQEDSNENHD